MRFHTYIYGRTLNIDFREICSPSQSLSERSKDLIKELLNTDVPSNGNTKCLRYLFVREKERIIFGVGISHKKYLEKQYWTDGIRELRSFIGIVIYKDEFDNTPSIPTDPEFFTKLYMEKVENIWSLEDRPKNRKIIESNLIEAEPQDNWCSLDGSVEFNQSVKGCAYFPYAEKDNVLHSLKNCFSSVLIGLNTENHVKTAYRRQNVLIHNAVCIDTEARHEWMIQPSPVPVPPKPEDRKEKAKGSERDCIFSRLFKGEQPRQSQQASAKLMEMFEELTFWR